MTLANLFSAPGENYIEHISKCVEIYEKIVLVYIETIKRVFEMNNEENIKDCFRKMILFHDLGKLTKKWQDRIGTGSKLPSHAQIGAGYLWKILPDGFKEPLSFAVAIHHTDRGLLSDVIERPDVLAIKDGIVDVTTGKFIWHEDVDKLKDLFPDNVRNLTVYDLREMAVRLRIWARGGSIWDQHKARMKVALAHHILKLCDIKAATKRRELREGENENFWGGWLMTKEIEEYVDSVLRRV